MKTLLAALVMVGTMSVAQAQFRSQTTDESRISSGIVRDESSLLFGWFDPSKFQMHHMMSFSYQTFGNQGLSLGTYTNMMSYQFSDKLDAQADVSLSYSPFNNLSGFGKNNNDLSKIYLSRAQLTYHPWENTVIQLQYRALPYGYFNSPFSSPWLMEPGY